MQNKLNNEQQLAVKYIDGPLLVLAGAGSGKTKVITQKIIYLINKCGYLPKSIYAVTFTNKAANEMRERIAKELNSKERQGLKISTFHTLGLAILKKETKICGLKPKFSIFDSEDCLQILRNLLPKHLNSDRSYILSAQAQISSWKNELLTTEEVNKRFSEHQFNLIYKNYQLALKNFNAIDFDDLICIPVILFLKNQERLEAWQNKIRYLLVDEYQDSNTSQYQLVKLLVGCRANFTVVGDDDQSIYAWRGAKPENLHQLSQDYANLKIIKLEQNYRSTNNILQMANHLISQNSHILSKNLWSALGLGELIKIIYCKDEEDEALQIVGDLINHKLRLREKYGNYAILYRGNHQSKIFEKVLRNQGISYKISGGQSWFSRVEIRDILAYLKLISDPNDDAAFLRIINTPKRGIGENTLNVLADYAQRVKQSLFAISDHLALSELIKDKPRLNLQKFKLWLNNLSNRYSHESFSEIFQELIDEINYESYLNELHDSPLKVQKIMDNIWELYEWIKKLLEKEESRDLKSVINHLTLMNLLEQSNDNSENDVQLMTLHAAKGLEFNNVYLIGMEEELLPHRESIENNQIEEERRLLYVGITRAKLRLCITLAKQRKKGGRIQHCEPSRFLNELPSKYIEFIGKTTNENEGYSKDIAKKHLLGLKTLLN